MLFWGQECTRCGEGHGYDSCKALDRDEIYLEKVSLESKMKLRLRAEYVGVIGWFEGRDRDGLEILDICWERPIRIYLVLDGLRDRRLEVILDEMLKIVLTYCGDKGFRCKRNKYLGVISIEVMI